MCHHAPHRHPIFCILPPQILRELARNGTAAERDVALATLATDQTARMTRVTCELQESGAHHALMTAGPARKQRTVYDGGAREALPGRVVRNEGDMATKDAAVNEAYDGLGATWDFYFTAYQRNSIDDRGVRLDATVHYAERYDNAFWNGQQMIFGDGDGKYFNRFTAALDVIGHELTHGVTGSEARLAYLGQPGALNESISDVFGSLVKQFTLDQTADRADWLIGVGLLSSRVKANGGRAAALRSLKSPGTGYNDPVLGKDPQPAHMADFVHTSRDNGGVHINSGIPNRAFYLAAMAIGGKAWERAGRIWYETIRDRQLKPTAQFADFALRTAMAAGRLYGSASHERTAVLAAWRQVGVTVPSLQGEPRGPANVTTVGAADKKAVRRRR